LTNVETELELLHGLFCSDFSSSGNGKQGYPSFMPEGRSCFLCMEGALPFWQKRTSLAECSVISSSLYGLRGGRSCWESTSCV